MWTHLVRFILRNRLVNLVIIFGLTAFMAYQARKVEMSYEFGRVLPSNDPTSITYEKFKKVFGEDGSVLFLGIQDPRILNQEVFRDWYKLTYRIKQVDGVQDVVSIGRMFHLVKNDSTKKLDFKLLYNKEPKSQKEVDSIINLILSYPFYNGFLYNKETYATIMALTIDKNKIDSKKRFKLVDDITRTCEEFHAKHNIKVHYSGLPYIRTQTGKKIENELYWFTFIALLVASIVLFIYFRSYKAVFIPLIIVGIGVVWVLGTMSLFKFKITMLTGVLPPLLIIIGIENCIFLINKYHFEYKAHQNKVKALSRMIQKAGLATLLTNLTTAIGFGIFIFTRNRLMYEFGLVASINIIIIYIFSVFLIPIFFSYLNPPLPRHLQHLDNLNIQKLVNKALYIVQNKRGVVFTCTIVLVVISIFGISRLNTTGNIVDDIPVKDPLYTDLMFFEKNFKGVMPFEISIDTKKKRGVMQLSTIKKIDRLQDSLKKYPEFSSPLSIAEVAKFAKQAFYNGDPFMYNLPGSNEMIFMSSYIPKIDNKKRTILNSFIDTNMQLTRISVQMANIGTNDIQRIKDDLEPKIDSIFDNKDYKVDITGTSVVFLEGTKYLIGNLLQSFILALILISIIMALLFSSFRMVVISIIPNILPLLATAAMMGFIGIAIKPTTIVIFSIALGISVDNSILFLSRYRQYLRDTKWQIRESVLGALRETGFSMLYSSSVLCLGFCMFIFSSFGGTQSLGYLITFTLFVALGSNLLFLPSLLLYFDNKATTKAFEEPFLEILDEEKDIDSDEPNAENQNDNNGNINNNNLDKSKS